MQLKCFSLDDTLKKERIQNQKRGMQMKNQKSYISRLCCYVGGFLLMTMGVALSVKSGLGVSPVSSIPYTLTCISGIDMGITTVIFHIFLVLLQIVLLRKSFQLKNLLQIPAGMLFGVLTTFCNSIVATLPAVESIPIRLIMMLISTVFIAFGVFFYVPADIIPLAGEGAMLAISQVTNIQFATVKTAFDVTMVVVSSATCLIVLHSLGSVGIGTILAAILVGSNLKVINRLLAKPEPEVSAEA
jgi:uncharacterized membrane protein YczE